MEVANLFPDLLEQFLAYRRDSWLLAFKVGIACG
jgi:hypothetical protein